MNCNELLREIQKRLVESGISDIVTEFVREHPEYWTQNNHYIPAAGYNTSCNIVIGFNTQYDVSPNDISPNDMTQATPFYMLNVGRNQSKNVDMTIHPNSNKVYTDYWYQGEIQFSHVGNLNG